MIKGIIFDLGNTLIREVDDTTMPITDWVWNKLPHTDEVLAQLREKYQLAIITNTTTFAEKDVRRVLRQLSIEHYFEFILTSVDFGVKKPDARIFKEALRRLGLAPDEIVMVGDRIEIDIAGANALGISTVHYHWCDKYPYKISHPVEKPAFIISDLKELLSVLDKLSDDVH